MTKFWIKKRSPVSAPVIYYTIMRYRAHFLLQRTYRIKGILFSILSLSGPLSGEPDRVSQMMVLIKTVSKTNSPLFCLSVIYIQKSFQRWNKYLFADIEKIWGLNSIYFHTKTILSGDYRIHFRTDMEHHICRPVNNSDVSLGYQFCKNNTFILCIIYNVRYNKYYYILRIQTVFFCVHMIMCGTRCVKLSWLVVYFRFRQVNIPHTSIGYVYSFTF